VFTNNLARHSKYGIMGSDRAPGNDSIAALLPASRIAGNVIAEADPDHYPAGNDYPSLAAFQLAFVDYAGGNYTLVVGSPWRSTGSAPGAALGSSAITPPLTPAATSTTTGSTTTAKSRLANSVLPSDFDEDGKADLTVYRPSNGTWFNLRSSTGYKASTTYQWGLPGDIPVSGDYDGDGATDPGVYRPATGTWFLPWFSGVSRATCRCLVIMTATREPTSPSTGRHSACGSSGTRPPATPRRRCFRGGFPAT
jgi:hypothetical protein